jgi:hypothetical protein
MADSLNTTNLSRRDALEALLEQLRPKTTGDKSSEAKTFFLPRCWNGTYDDHRRSSLARCRDKHLDSLAIIKSEFSWSDLRRGADRASSRFRASVRLPDLQVVADPATLQRSKRPKAAEGRARQSAIQWFLHKLGCNTPPQQD